MRRISSWVPGEQWKIVKALATAKGVSASEVVRTAVAEHLERCRADRESQRRQRRTDDREWKAFDLLTG